jgi:hypothetical protein
MNIRAKETRRHEDAYLTQEVTMNSLEIDDCLSYFTKLYFGNWIYFRHDARPRMEKAIRWANFIFMGIKNKKLNTTDFFLPRCSHIWELAPAFGA